MTDRYLSFVNSPLGRALAENLGIPRPPVLERHKEGGAAFSRGNGLVGMSPKGELMSHVASILAAQDNPVFAPDNDEALKAAYDTELNLQSVSLEAMGRERFKTVVYDASGLKDSASLVDLHRFFHPVLRQVESCGRIVVLGRIPELCALAAERTAQRALEGFTRSLGKEVAKGATAQLIYVEPGAEHLMESTLRFFLSPKSAYVSGQVVTLRTSEHLTAVDWHKPLSGKVALVTGAARGIGAAIAEVLARDGAHVVALDVPQAEADLKALTQRIGGSSLTMDITGYHTPLELSQYLQEQHQGVDIVVHNAGITRDKTLARMKQDFWNLVLNVNLISEERINEALLAHNALRRNGRIICVSSISGIAGNLGQTNYATSKAGVIGMVQSQALAYAKAGITINAVAPGFIETQMTAAVPFAIREVGRRLNSMSQGGLPVDVAETIAWFANPASSGLYGNIVRVCGQSFLGA